jgi:uncharacterized protein
LQLAQEITATPLPRGYSAGAAVAQQGNRASVKRCDNRLVPSAEAAMNEFLQFVVQQLVNNPNAVEVRETRGDTASILELRVAKEDLGRVIGKQGRTAKSLRVVLNAAASRTNRKVVLEIIKD